MALAKNEVLPDLRLQASYLTNGLGGTELIRDSFLGPVIGQTVHAVRRRAAPAVRRELPDVDRRLHAQLPARQERRSRPRSRAPSSNGSRAAARLRSAEFKAVREVRQAALQLDQNRQRIETTRLARELSEQRLDAEQKRFEVGMSTNFNVIQAQRDLAVARNDELQAQLDYQLAWIAFNTVQKVGGALSGPLQNRRPSGPRRR